MDAPEHGGEDVALCHGKIHARGGKDHGVVGAKGGDHHDYSDPLAAAAEDPIRDIGGDQFRLRHDVDGQHPAICDVHEQVNCGHDEHPEHGRARHDALRVADFTCDVGGFHP